MRRSGSVLPYAAAVLACAAAAAAADRHDAAAAPAAAFDSPRMTGFASEVLGCFDITGMGVALTGRDQTLYAEGIGLRDSEAQLPVGPDTTFSVASTTKAWTTALTAVLIGEGYLPGWDAKVRDVIGGFALNDSIASQLVTLRDLGAHKVGVPRNDFLWQSGSANGVSRSELSERVRWFPSQHEMRQRYEYNNWMYMALGHAAEAAVADGSSWEELLASRLSAPLGMGRTTASVDAAIASGNYAVP